MVLKTIPKNQVILVNYGHRFPGWRIIFYQEINQLFEKCEEKSHQADFPGNLVMPHFSLLKLGNLWLPGMHLHYRITDDEKM